MLISFVVAWWLMVRTGRREKEAEGRGNKRRRKEG